MLNLLLAVALSSNPAAAPLQFAPPTTVLFAQDRGDKKDKEKEKVEEEKLDPKQVEAAVDALKGAFKKGGEVADKLEAIEAALAYSHEDIAKAIAKGLKDKEQEVVLTSIVALARLENPVALKELVGAYKRDRAIKKDDRLFAAILKSIGSYGDPDYVDLLSDDLLKHPSKDVIRARILGLGNTRCKESAEALMTIMSSAAKKYVNPHMAEINLALGVLTGADEGKSQDRWITWWNANKRTLRISETPGDIGGKNQVKWDAYWNFEPKEKKDERKKKDKREKREDE